MHHSLDVELFKILILEVLSLRYQLFCDDFRKIFQKFEFMAPIKGTYSFLIVKIRKCFYAAQKMFWVFLLWKLKRCYFFYLYSSIFCKISIKTNCRRIVSVSRKLGTRHLGTRLSEKFNRFIF